VLFDLSSEGRRALPTNQPRQAQASGVSFFSSFDSSTARLAMRTYDKLIATIPERRDVDDPRPCSGHGIPTSS
jgi:hypothetical protein